MARTTSIKVKRKDEALPEALRFHDLRYTCAALLIASGRHVEDIKDHLRHSTIRVTNERYGRHFPNARATLAESLEATFQTDAAIPTKYERRTTAVISASRKKVRSK
jgi:integrase